MWSLDLGTTNSTIARWEQAGDRPELLALDGICLAAAQGESLESSCLIPSVLEILPRAGFSRALAESRFFSRWSSAQLALIGREALERSTTAPRAGFVRGFKRVLGSSPLRTLTVVDKRAHGAREVAWLFLRELLLAAQRATGERIRELTLTTPVDSYESYRAELQSILSRLGVRKIRFLDEPVAAALGYGLAVERVRRALVVDFGGGTLDLALVELTPRSVAAGACRVIGKAGADLGGELVDRWLLAEFCRRLDYPLIEAEDSESRFWAQLMLNEARRVKEAVFFTEQASFDLMPPEELRDFAARLRGRTTLLSITRAEVRKVLEDRGVYRTLESCLAQVLTQAEAAGVAAEAIDDVLLVGGSTLLPDVFGLFERRFGRARVRAWQPFEAVAYGACAQAAGRVQHTDFIVHDYALLTYDATTGAPEYSIIVPRGTRFPTEPDLWKRRLVPTCALGEPERFFKLVVCELGDRGPERKFGFDEHGRVHKLDERAGDAERLVVKLNETNPTLGDLDPPHLASDRRPRLEVAFGVSAERWLCATVTDLATKKPLMTSLPVVRLL